MRTNGTAIGKVAGVMIEAPPLPQKNSTADPIMRTFIDRYIEQGRQQGIEQGIEQGMEVGEKRGGPRSSCAKFRVSSAPRAIRYLNGSPTLIRIHSCAGRSASLPPIVWMRCCIDGLQHTGSLRQSPVRHAARALIAVPATGGRGFSRSGVSAPLISFGYVGNRHRLKPRPPVADGPLPAGTMIKAATRYQASLGNQKEQFSRQGAKLAKVFQCVIGVARFTRQVVSMLELPDCIPWRAWRLGALA